MTTAPRKDGPAWGSDTLPVTLLVNHPTWEQQQALLDKHAKSVVRGTTMIFAAGVLTGILGGTKMIDEMAETLVSVVPDSFGSHLPVAVAVTGMPLSLVFTPDAYYFGVLPVLAETASGFGTEPAEVARAAILGHDRRRPADRRLSAVTGVPGPGVTGAPGPSGVPADRGLRQPPHMPRHAPPCAARSRRFGAG
ncbi:SLC13 family permease [Streptomyces swartbergensis]|uniref:SLC13 family permease n=1 Tax=Streptomyces swartbergensis TaxID=487165 RepID=UPI0037FE1A44